MMDLSVIIVNYNVRQFVLQTLHSVYQSELDNLSIEVIVVDNNSADGSVTAIREHFQRANVVFRRHGTV